MAPGETFYGMNFSATNKIYGEGFRLVGLGSVLVTGFMFGEVLGVLCLIGDTSWYVKPKIVRYIYHLTIISISSGHKPLLCLSTLLTLLLCSRAEHTRRNAPGISPKQLSYAKTL